jgi:hypothetical protein
MMPLANTVDANRNGIEVVLESSCPELDQKGRIIEALGLLGEHLPSVDEKTLSRYYTYLTARLSFPFTAYYPKPATFQEEEDFRCTVLELVAPAKHLDDGFDGIFCNIHKGIYKVNLPLIDLYLPEDTFSFQIIDDYWYWFWNWR